MKKLITIYLLMIVMFTTYGQTKQPIKKTTATKTASTKFGALAIDRSNGLYYGWSHDYSTLSEAEQKAVEECKKKGGNCTVVLSYSGTGCAAYRTINGKVGTAFGWGLAKTKEQADAIANKECLKRSAGIIPENFVWSCNSANTGVLKEIYNASDEIFNTVKISNQEWATENLAVVKFKNGDPITEAKTSDEWQKLCKDKTPAFTNLCDLPNQQNCGIIYNVHAIKDARGVNPDGWHIPTESDWKTLVNNLGGVKKAGAQLATKDWSYTKGNNSSGFNGRPCDGTTGGVRGKKLEPTYEYGIMGTWWSSTRERSSSDPDSHYMFWIRSYDSYITGDFGNSNWAYGNYIRLVKN
ncbi:DUF4189 domain-containing protein [Flavobacterium sp. LS1R49]|uniref:DUF4189 domain-containing protein n=1 Tax=Flavobacterium shii TaxID=2987687 RepID=A0A9X2YXZ3_9FLAO|nr:FISUMP domain-containing protein [Flavobacterium shii]MCV9930454.1 DUF4189 domain-containing protein [Flavobacterium shii]